MKWSRVCLNVTKMALVSVHVSLGTRPSKNQKGGSGKLDGVEVYTAPGMQTHVRLAFD